MTVLDKLFVRDPQNSKAYLLAGQIFYEMGDTGRAVNAYQKAVDFNPDLREAWIRLGSCCVNWEPLSAYPILIMQFEWIVWIRKYIIKSILLCTIG